MAFWAYILRCSDGRYYTGHTDNLDRRFAEHHCGGFSDFTSRRRPVTLVWQQSFQTRVEALAVEAQIKSWSRAKKEALIAGDWAGVSFYARPPKERGVTAPFVSSEVETSDARSLDFARDEWRLDLPTPTPPLEGRG